MTSGSVVESSGGTQAVDRAAALIALVVEAESPVTFTELSAACGLARSTTSRLLAALERTRLLERCATGEYIAGPLFALYAARHDRGAELARIARPLLERVGEAVGESVHLGVLNGARVLHIDQVDSTYLLGARDWNDVEVPPHCSALGKVMLAWGGLALPDSELEALTQHTLSTVAEVKQNLEESRRRGFAFTLDELEIGLSGVAAPVFGHDDTVVATIGVSGPTARLQERIDQIGLLLKEEADALSALLRHGTRTTEGVA